VWARSGATWYRSTITRVENPVMARVRFPAGAGKPEVPVSPLQIRLPAD